MILIKFRRNIARVKSVLFLEYLLQNRQTKYEKIRKKRADFN